MLSKKIMVFSASVMANILWGASVLFWPFLNYLDPIVILAQRIIWAMVFVFFVLLIERKFYVVLNAFKNPKQITLLLLSAIFIFINWYSFVYTVNSGLALEASLGYYLSPLTNIFIAGVFFKEKLNTLQKIALFLVCSSVIYNIISYGTFPYLSFCIGGSFSIYVYINKIIKLEALFLFFIQMLLLSPFCLAILYNFDPINLQTFNMRSGHILLMFSTVIFTAIPLILYIYGVKNLSLTSVSFIQYISPNLAFLLAIFVVGDEVSSADYVTFPLIWLALGLCAYDMMKKYKKINKLIENKI